MAGDGLPGAMAVGTRDYARADRTAERGERSRQLQVDADLSHFLATGEWPADPPPSRVITEWSPKSRARMVRRFCELDYSPLITDVVGQRHGRVPALVTLTYPGDWQVVAPDGPTTTAHLRAFRERWRRAWNEDPVAIWKREFQRRGAPHFHLLMLPPHGVDAVLGLPFRRWLSQVWAEIVDHPDPEQRELHLLAGTGVDTNEGLRGTDPRRIAIYFLKHSTGGRDDQKEYQHTVPEAWQEPGKSCGRFWGYWRFQPVRATVLVTPDVAVAAARTMRRWSRAQGLTRPVRRPRTRGGRPEPVEPVVTGLSGAQLLGRRRQRWRRTTTRIVRVAHGRGWLALNDGASFAAQLSRYLDQVAGGGPGP